jgi:hypothetical protein
MSWASDTLTLVQTAISNYLTGGANKSYSIAGRSFTKENLSDLLEFRAQLQREVAEEGTSGNFVLAELGGAASYQRFEL